MSFVEDFRGALAPVGLPCAQGGYTGEAPSYLVFNYTATPAFSADDAVQYVRIGWMLHLFMPPEEDPTALQGRILQALAAGGYDCPAREDASEERAVHIVYELESVVTADEFQGAGAGRSDPGL